MHFLVSWPEYTWYPQLAVQWAPVIYWVTDQKASFFKNQSKIVWAFDILDNLEIFIDKFILNLFIPNLIHM